MKEIVLISDYDTLKIKVCKKYIYFYVDIDNCGNIFKIERDKLKQIMVNKND